MGNVLYLTTDYHAALCITEVDGVTPVNLDGKTLELVVKRMTGAAALVTLTSGAGITHRTQTGEDIGWADAVITSAQSTEFEAPTPHVVHVLLDGAIVVRPRYLEIVAL